VQEEQAQLPREDHGEKDQALRSMYQKRMKEMAEFIKGL